MAERVFLIHGWSVQETTTYQALHHKLAAHGFDLHEIFLGRYVSLDNEVEIQDLSRALHNELMRVLGRSAWPGPIHFITHSTGALVVKHWTVNHYRPPQSGNRPLRNLVFLAGPHFGSRLAHHGRSMMAHARYTGDTGKKILEALELGSPFSWDSNGAWLDPGHWKGKGIRPFCLIGDKVERAAFASRIFPAGYEKGSDMVVRVAAGNLNFRRYRLRGDSDRLELEGEIRDVPFGALDDCTHSGPKHGIMNCITMDADPRLPKCRNLRLILDCLAVRTNGDYSAVRDRLAAVTRKTRRTRAPFAQLDFRFRDDNGDPIDDYSFVLGYFQGRGGKKRKASDTVEHIHKNKVDPSRLTAYIECGRVNRRLTYFVELDSKSGTDLYSYLPDPLFRKLTGGRIQDLVIHDQTTQIDVILTREPHRSLFVFHRGDDPDLHVGWDRKGRVVKKHLKTK
jgi:hypothetical protein